MPDANGRFRGITVPRLPWLEPAPEPVTERTDIFKPCPYCRTIRIPGGELPTCDCGAVRRTAEAWRNITGRRYPHGYTPR